MFLPIVISIIVIYFALIYFSRKRKLPRFPSGPSGLPVIGNIHQLDLEVHKTFAKLRDQYGDIFSIQLGSLRDTDENRYADPIKAVAWREARAIILHDPKHIKEAFSKDEFSWRPVLPHLREQETGIQRGIIGSKGNTWDEQRKFAMKTLHDFGLKYGSSSMESLIHQEVSILMEEFGACAGAPVNTASKFGVATINSLWILVAGKRFENNDPKVKLLLDCLHKMTTSTNTQGLLVFFPWLAKYFPRLSGLTGYLELMAPIYNMIKDCISEHKNNDPSGGKFDLIDCYLEEMKKPNQQKLSFIGKDGDANLMTTVFDLFIAGAETTSSTLTWICLLLAHHPEVQEKVSEEINSVVGTTRLPSLQDRQRMPYCEAMILETMRFATIGPLSVFHCARQDTEFQGYKIPKDTVIIANQWFVDHNPKTWDEPNKFMPERFLIEDGMSIIRHEAFTPFSIGKRMCPGEGLARDELFLFSTAIFQRFQVGFVPGKPVPVLKGFAGTAVSSALPHELQMIDTYKKSS